MKMENTSSCRRMCEFDARQFLEHMQAKKCDVKCNQASSAVSKDHEIAFECQTEQSVTTER